MTTDVLLLFGPLTVVLFAGGDGGGCPAAGVPGSCHTGSEPVAPRWTNQ